MTESPAVFWWNSITNARMIISSVTRTLNDNKMVILDIPCDLPWRSEMRNSIQFLFRKASSNEEYLFHTIDVADECGDTDPGRYLLNRFCVSREVRSSYRTHSSKTIQQYIIDNQVLHNSIIWLKGFHTAQIGKWIKFCRDYRSHSISDGLFLLELHDYRLPDNPDFARIIRFNDMITEYDVQLLNSFILNSDDRYSTSWKKYISTLAAALCGRDAELSSELIENINLTAVDPIEGLREIAAQFPFSRRGDREGSEHVLALLRRNDLEQIQKRIWVAQVQNLYPLIELERVYYINKYLQELQIALNRDEIKYNNELITRPDDIELGTYYYLLNSHKVSLYNEEDQNRIEFLRDCRNSLSHLHALDVIRVSQLLQKHE